MHWCKRAAEENGDVGAMFRLAWRYERGAGVVQDSALADKWYERAADADSNHSWSLSGWNLASACEDKALAARLLTRLARAGDASAMWNLARCFETGAGVDQDFKLAVEWFKRAAEAGDTSAMCSLTRCFEDGVGVAKNEKSAALWKAQALNED